MAVKLEELAKQALTEVPPPMAITIILVPFVNANGAVESRLQVQWPPQMAPEGVLQALGAAMQVLQGQVRQQAGGLWTPT